MMNTINWKAVCNKIEYWNTSIGDDYGYAESYPMETIECARYGGCLLDLDNMVHLRDLMHMSVSYNLYKYIDSHYDGSLMELGDEDLPALEWLVQDYANGNLPDNADIWKDYDYADKDKYGFVGWHKRVKKGE